MRKYCPDTCGICKEAKHGKPGMNAELVDFVGDFDRYIGTY
jgi:hypothetical protein